MSCYIARVQLLLCCSAHHFVVLVSSQLTSCICIFVLVSLFKQKRYISVKSYVSILKMKREFLNTSPPLVPPHIHLLNVWINNSFVFLSTKIIFYYQWTFRFSTTPLIRSEDCCVTFRLLRAPTADVLNVPNAKFLAHLAHQTQKRSFIRCSKW